MQDSYIYKLITLNKIAMRKSHEVHITPLTPEEMKKEGAYSVPEEIPVSTVCQSLKPNETIDLPLHFCVRCYDGAQMLECNRASKAEIVKFECYSVSGTQSGVLNMQCGSSYLSCNGGPIIGGGGSSGSGGMKPENPSGTFATHPHWTPGKSGGLL